MALATGGGFGTPGGQEQDPPGIEDGADAHGDGALGHFRFVREDMAIVFDGFAAQRL
jgi:hypothetical protein